MSLIQDHNPITNPAKMHCNLLNNTEILKGRGGGGGELPPPPPPPPKKIKLFGIKKVESG